MRRFKLFSIGLLLMLCFGSFVLGQDRISLDVPIVDPTAITLDAVMNEAAWSGAAEVNLVTSAGYNIFSLYYGREGLLEPEYDEYYARLLWSEDTLFAFIHIDEIVNDSSGLYWGGQWVGDQLFVSLSNRFGVDLPDDGFEYDGNVYAAPDGPYHYLILGDQVTLNNEALTNIPEEYRKCVDQSDSQKVFLASDYTRWAVSIDTINGVWNLELAIYHPDVNAQGCVGFNIGGSQGSWQNDPIAGDAYAYYTWQPNIPDDPFGDPFGNGDPGFYNLNNSQYWAVLNFVDGADRLEMDVPIVDPTAITLDAVMNEAAWSGAAEVNLVTSAGYNIFSLYYGREGLLEPEYDEYYARLLWSEDTLFAFIHIDEIVNDSSGLYWDGQWVGDQLFVSLSNRFGVDLPDDGFEYDGNVYAAPDGPYHYLILGDQVTLNNEALTNVPEEYRGCFADSQLVFNASDHARWAVSIDTITGVWNLEMAIYHPNVNSQACIGFNIGGSQGSWQNDPIAGDAYAYYTWQPNIPDDPFGDPFGNGDPGFYNLNNSQYWAVLNFVPGPLDVKEEESPLGPPTAFNLLQNYPNPFNPTTTIKFEVPKQSAVYLKIYNVVGEDVATLVNGEVLGNGTYSVTFDAGNLSSGIYFYELRADNIIQSKKMILLK